MTETTNTPKDEPQVTPLWFKLSAAAIGVVDAVLIAFSISTPRTFTFVEFAGIVALVALLTGVIVGVGFAKGYLRKRHAVDAYELDSVAEEVVPVVLPEQQQVEAPEEERRISIKDLLKPSNLLARKISQRTRVMTLAGSALTALVLIFVATFAYPTFQVRPTYDNVMVGIFIIVLIPSSLLDVITRAYLKQIDSRIPDFLRDIADSQRTGVPFTRALTNATHTNYGVLTRELRKAMAKMSLGFTFEEALDAFADSAETPLARRAAVLLKEVGRSGGKMLEVLDSVYEHIREVINLQKERSKQLTPYIIVIYASFGVYIFVVYILFSTFFAQVGSLVKSGAPFGTNINPGVYYIWFYHMAIIESVVGGLVAGKISAGTATAGLKHVLVLIIMSFITFTFFIQV